MRFLRLISSLSFRSVQLLRLALVRYLRAMLSLVEAPTGAEACDLTWPDRFCTDAVREIGDCDYDVVDELVALYGAELASSQRIRSVLQARAAHDLDRSIRGATMTDALVIQLVSVEEGAAMFGSLVPAGAPVH